MMIRNEWQAYKNHLYYAQRVLYQTTYTELQTC